MKILIIEDDPLWQKIFKLYLDSLGEIRIAKNLTELQYQIISFSPDIVVADIHVEGHSMIDYLANKVEITCPILFTTGFISEEIMLQSVTISNSLFLSKPVERYTLEASIIHLVKNYRESKGGKFNKIHEGEGIWTKDNLNQPFQILYHEIIYIKADGNYVLVQTKKKVFSFKKSLIKMILELPQNFVRISKFVVINLNSSEDIQILFNDIRIGNFVFKVGRTYRKDLLIQLLNRKNKINEHPK